MATLTEIFTGIANTIRDKTGLTEEYTPNPSASNSFLNAIANMRHHRFVIHTNPAQNNVPVIIYNEKAQVVEQGTTDNYGRYTLIMNLPYAYSGWVRIADNYYFSLFHRNFYGNITYFYIKDPMFRYITCTNNSYEKYYEMCSIGSKYNDKIYARNTNSDLSLHAGINNSFTQTNITLANHYNTAVPTPNYLILADRKCDTPADYITYGKEAYSINSSYTTSPLSYYDSSASSGRSWGLWNSYTPSYAIVGLGNTTDGNKYWVQRALYAISNNLVSTYIGYSKLYQNISFVPHPTGAMLYNIGFTPSANQGDKRPTTASFLSDTLTLTEDITDIGIGTRSIWGDILGEKSIAINKSIVFNDPNGDYQGGKALDWAYTFDKDLAFSMTPLYSTDLAPFKRAYFTIKNKFIYNTGSSIYGCDTAGTNEMLISNFDWVNNNNWNNCRAQSFGIINNGYQNHFIK